MQWLTLHNPYDREDDVRDQHKRHRQVHGCLQPLAVRNANEEEADGDFRPHEGRKRLNPLAIGVLEELAELVGGEVGLACTKAIVDFHEAEGGADCST